MLKVLRGLFRRPQRHDYPPFNDGTRWFLEVRAEVIKRRPDLLGDFNPLLYEPVGATAQFLDKHFPIEGRWGELSFPGVQDRIRSY